MCQLGFAVSDFLSERLLELDLSPKFNTDVSTEKFLQRSLRWWAESAPSGWIRVVKVSENLGVVVPVALWLHPAL